MLSFPPSSTGSLRSVTGRLSQHFSLFLQLQLSEVKQFQLRRPVECLMRVLGPYLVSFEWKRPHCCTSTSRHQTSNGIINNKYCFIQLCNVFIAFTQAECDFKSISFNIIQLNISVDFHFHSIRIAFQWKTYLNQLPIRLEWIQNRIQLSRWLFFIYLKLATLQ